MDGWRKTRQTLLAKLSLSVKVARYALEIWVVDWMPNFVRRRILANEYSGDALERRLKLRIGGGWRMVAALWRFTSVHTNIKATVGAKVPVLTLERACGPDEAGGAEVLLSNIGAPGILATLRNVHVARKGLLVVNFGSCT